RFNRLGVKKVITLSPHAFNAMKKYYPEYGAGFETLHYTQLLWELIKSKKLNPGKLETRVTYHDPCYLGRHNGEYQVPRKVLQSIPGLTLIEMRRNRKDSFCCGGGGGNFFTDILGSGPDSPAVVRVKEEVTTGAEVLAVACPNCAKMFEDAIKAEGLENHLRVRDMCELVLESLKD
ncbi:MAG: (Fe-S)-binding protein, partial [Syntrophomonadaceae bacterium]|nr:(Fe-S)-binding protein [Syntrophomonadaceae bacterium]